MSKRRKAEMKALAFFMIVVVVIGANVVYALGETNTVKKVNYVTVSVWTGDTLWSIANEYKPDDCDVRKFIYEIKKLNNLKGENVFAGQDLKIPQ